MNESFGARVARFERHVTEAQEYLANLASAERAHLKSAERLEAAKIALEEHMARWLVPEESETRQQSREVAVLDILAKRQGEIIANSQIIEALIARRDDASPKTLNSAVSRILSKLAERGEIRRIGQGKWQYDVRLPAREVFGAVAEVKAPVSRSVHG